MTVEQPRRGSKDFPLYVGCQKEPITYERGAHLCRSDAWVAQVKYDGMFIAVKDGKAWSRHGNPVEVPYPLPSTHYTLYGELMRGTERAKDFQDNIYYFDCNHSGTLLERLQVLKDILAPSGSLVARTETTPGYKQELLDLCGPHPVRHDFEGLVFKTARSKLLPGHRQPTWLKYKHTETRQADVSHDGWVEVDGKSYPVLNPKALRGRHTVTVQFNGYEWGIPRHLRVVKRY